MRVESELQKSFNNSSLKPQSLRFSFPKTFGGILDALSESFSSVKKTNFGIYRTIIRVTTIIR